MLNYYRIFFVKSVSFASENYLPRVRLRCIYLLLIMKGFVKRNRVIVFLSVFTLFISGCQSKYPGVPEEYFNLLDSALIKAQDNAVNIVSVLKDTPKEQKIAAAFLIAYMPEKDLQTLSSEFISDQVNGAWKVRNEFEWCRSLPDSIFLNEVLPYFSLDEKRDNWREDFYNKFAPLVQDCKNVYDAIDAVNRNIKSVLNVEYNTKRSIVNISPFQAMEENMATCTGLSFLLVDAFRSVGIPARVVGTPLWTNMRGNHNWVEVWVDGKWYFTEYYPDKLNQSWFLADAGKADPQKPIHWIYASSYKPGNTYFLRVWDRNAKDINAVNVTERYIRLYQKQLEELKEDELLVDVVLYNRKGDESAANRVHEKVTVWNSDKQVDFGFTPQPTDDLNRFLKFRLKKNTSYRLEFAGSFGDKKERMIETGEKSENVIKLFQE